MLGKTFKKDQATANNQEDRFHGLKVNPDLLLYHDTGRYLLFNIGLREADK